MTERDLTWPTLAGTVPDPEVRRQWLDGEISDLHYAKHLQRAGEPAGSPLLRALHRLAREARQQPKEGTP